MCVVLCILVAFVFSACSPSSQSENYEPQYERVKILYIDPPKHFRLKYELLINGHVYQVSSKHCSDWKRVSVGYIYIADVKKTGCNFVRSIKF